MFENEWFPPANAMGVTWQEFWGMNPHIINCLQKGHEEKMKEQDRLQYLWWREYGISALIFAIEHNFAKNPCSEYLKEPILSNLQANRPLTEAEKERELEQFVRQNEHMRANWKRKKTKKMEAEKDGSI